VVPILLFAAIALVEPIAAASVVVATFWDVWHSAAQTFGFARIYDRNAGNHPQTMRRLDFWMNQLLYVGPILAGATLANHLAHFAALEEVDITLFSQVPVELLGHQGQIAWGVAIAGLLFTAFYVIAYWRLYRRGYVVSWHKVFLIASTGACSMCCWAFNSWGEAFFVMNLFHAVQYLALVWVSERKTVVARFGGHAKVAALVAGTAILSYGFAAEIVDRDFRIFWAITMTVSLLHFWYDSFIWSVARRQV
jgi:hypothetical protein